MSASPLEVLRGVDRETHAALQAAMPAIADALHGDGGLAALVDLLALVAAEAPEAARAFASRLDALPAALADLAALRRWAVHGLTVHGDDAAARGRYFEQHDPLVFSDRLAEHDSSHLLAWREGLQCYLAGFCVPPRRIELHEPQGVGLPPQSIGIGDDVILFPRRSAVAPERRAALYRAAVAHAAAHLRFSRLARPAGNRQPMLLAVMGLIEDARVERLMVKAYPGLQTLWGGFHVATRANAGFDLAGLTARLAHALHDPAYDDGNAWVQQGRTLFEAAAAADLHDIAAFDHLARQLAIGIEKMRLALPRHYRVQPAYRDDHTLLWNLNAALPEDETRTVLREDYAWRLPDELPPDLKRAEVDPRRRVRHPEWDHRLETLREDWATVIESAATARLAPRAAAFARPRQRLRGLDRTPDRALRLTRLAEGDELDLTAAVDTAVQQRARLAPDGRVFRRHGRRRRATAIVLLMDLSVSTRRFVPGSFTTVLEVEKRAAKLVAQSLDPAVDRVALHGFASNGRHEVHYDCVKGFDEPFGPLQQARLAALEGRLSTRMGAALRHASQALQTEDADHKVILLLTDGEPSDVDVVEDDYLVEDARHAVVSAAQRGIRSFCLTLDRQADAYVRRIFGSRNYLIADHADAFAGHAGQTLVRLVAH